MSPNPANRFPRQHHRTLSLGTKRHRMKQVSVPLFHSPSAHMANVLGRERPDFCSPECTQPSLPSGGTPGQREGVPAHLGKAGTKCIPTVVADAQPAPGPLSKTCLLSLFPRQVQFGSCVSVASMDMSEFSFLFLAFLIPSIVRETTVGKTRGRRREARRREKRRGGGGGGANKT